MIYTFLLALDAALALDVSTRPALGGLNVIINPSDNTATSVASNELPDLPLVRTVSYGPLDSSGAFDGIISVGATLSLDSSNSFYRYGKHIRRSLQMFIDYVNLDLGGLNVSGQRFGIRFSWVGDGGSAYQVTNSTAWASRLYDADFLFAGYASSITSNAVKQAFAEGKLIMCGGAGPARD